MKIHERQKNKERFQRNAELGARYREATNNVLEGVKVESNWDERVMPVYQSSPLYVIIPGLLEFGGLYEHYQQLLQSDLNVDEAERTLTADLFPGLSVDDRVSLLRSSDPRILGLAAQTLVYHHQGERAVGSEYPGFEMNGVADLRNLSYRYTNVFSDEVIKILREDLDALSERHHYAGSNEEGNEIIKRILAIKQPMELKVLEEFAQIVRGERKIKKIRRRRIK